MEIGLARPFKDVLGVNSVVLPWSSVTVPASPHGPPGSRCTVATNQQPGLGEARVSGSMNHVSEALCVSASEVGQLVGRCCYCSLWINMDMMLHSHLRSASLLLTLGTNKYTYTRLFQQDWLSWKTFPHPDESSRVSICTRHDTFLFNKYYPGRLYNYNNLVYLCILK